MTTTFPDASTTGTVTVGDAVVRFRDTPGPDGSARLPVVLVHGTGGTADLHYAFVEPMLATRTRVVSLDLADTTTPVLELDDLLAQIGAVIDHVLPGRRITLVGMSLGATLAAAFAGRHPDAVENLVLIAGWARTDAHQRLRNSIWNALADGDPAVLARYTVYCAFGRTFLAGLDDESVEAMCVPRSPSPFLRRQMALNRDIDITDDVARIGARTLVVGLGEDQMVPRHHSLALFGAIEDARYAELPTGHAVDVERPAQLFALVDLFTADPARHPAGVIVQPPIP